MDLGRRVGLIVSDDRIPLDEDAKHKLQVLGLIVQEPADDFDAANLAKGVKNLADCPRQWVDSGESRSVTSSRAILVSILDQVGQECLNQRRQEVLQMGVQKLRPFLETLQLYV